jgi:hypothetical protein
MRPGLARSRIARPTPTVFRRGGGGRPSGTKPQHSTSRCSPAEACTRLTAATEPPHPIPVAWSVGVCRQSSRYQDPPRAHGSRGGPRPPRRTSGLSGSSLVPPEHWNCRWRAAGKVMEVPRKTLMEVPGSMPFPVWPCILRAAWWFNGQGSQDVKTTPREPGFRRRFCLSPDVGEAPPHRREPSKEE